MHPHKEQCHNYYIMIMHCNCAIGLQTDCMAMVVKPAPVVRLPDSHVYALWP